MTREVRSSWKFWRWKENQASVLYLLVVLAVADGAKSNKTSSAGQGQGNGSAERESPEKFNPLGPKVRCEYLPMDFLNCAELVDHKGNETAFNELEFGCVRVSLRVSFNYIATDVNKSAFVDWRSGAATGTRRSSTLRGSVSLCQGSRASGTKGS